MGEAARTSQLISPGELREVLADDGGDIVILDIRHAVRTDGPDLAAYRAGHLPGALFVDIDTDLAGVRTGTNGRRPLPSPAAFEQTVRHWGIDASDRVVVYGTAGSAAPARAWWLLRWAGLGSVRLLDGGIQGWMSTGGPVTTGDPGNRLPTAFVIRPGGLPVVELADVPYFAERGLLFDARPAAKFSHPTDAAAGHIPGARSAPVGAFFDTSGYLLPEAQLREQLRAFGFAAGSTPVSYCGTGVAAALEVFVLAVLGEQARLYVGSASEWTADPSRVLVR